MGLWHVILRGLWHYRRTGLVVIIGLAVATAVITGSLIVGASVSGSIRDTALARLGNISFAQTSRSYFRAALADQMAHEKKGLRITPLILTNGAAKNATSGATQPNVQVVGVETGFWALFPGAADPGLTGREIAVNATLARELGVQQGDSVLLNVDHAGTIAPDALFARRTREDTVRTLRLRVRAVLPDAGAGGFTLRTGTEMPRNLFVAQPWLQTALDKPGKANTLLYAFSSSVNVSAVKAASVYPDSRHLRWSDCGLSLTTNATQNYLALTSEQLLLGNQLIQTVRHSAKPLGKVADTSVYLATAIRQLPKAKDMPAPATWYALIAAVEPLQPFQFQAGGAKPLAKDGIWLNAWAALDLHARVGDRVALDYLVPTREGTFRTATATLTVEGIVLIAGPADDRGLMPEIDGITGAKTIDEWSPPFPLDLRRVTPRDEEYWNRYRTTPKAFVSPELTKVMWAAGSAGQRGDWVTSLRIAPKHGSDLAALQRKLQGAFHPNPFTFLPVREQALQASQGTTDFGQLFLGMSFFLVLAAAGLAAMLMRLTVERRAAEAGIMLACGVPPRTMAWALRGEGAVLTVLGVLLGVPLGVLYACGILHALATWWINAVGTSALWLHLTGDSLRDGGLSGLVIGGLALAWSVRRFGRARILELLAGWQAPRIAPRGGARMLARWSLIGLLAVTAVLLLLGAIGKAPAEETFFGIGAALLTGGFFGAYLALTRAVEQRITAPTLWRLAMRAMAANRGRSLLVLGLLAGASFIIVTVAVNARDFSRLDVFDRRSGAGGFALRAESTLPIRLDFSTPAGRKHLGFSPEDERFFAGTRVYPLLISPGDDISCLNLARSQQPRVLGLSPAFINRGGFSVITKEKRDNPWQMLPEHEVRFPTDDRVHLSTPAPVSVFCDADSVMWSLHSHLGGELYLRDSSAKYGTHAQYDGLLPGSIFAGELLIAEQHLRRLFPDVTIPRYFLIETPRDKEQAVADALRRTLGDFGLEVRGTRELLNAYIGVQNTYLATFLALGGLGLLLGTLGLTAVLLRNAFERRREFALLLATGFTRDDLTRLLLLENAGLLLAGLLCGIISALTATAPHLASVQAKVNWGALTAVLVAILTVGLGSCTLAARAAVRGNLLAALREE